MEIVTSWMEEGLEQGLQRERSLILRQLARRIGELPEHVRALRDTRKGSQLDTLPIAQLEALLDFSNLSDVEAWLEQSDQGA